MSQGLGDADVTVAERADAARHNDVIRAVEGNADVRNDDENDGIPHTPEQEHATQQGQRAQLGHDHGVAVSVSATHRVRTV